MPKGVYQRKPGQKRNYTPEQRAMFRERMKKVRELNRGRGDTPAMKEAKSQNAKKAQAIRTARAILKHLPVGAVAGTEFKASHYRNLRVIDAAPVKTTDASGAVIWEQKFDQWGEFSIYGTKQTFSSKCRIVWEYAPTLENIMDRPRFEEQGQALDGVVRG